MKRPALLFICLAGFAFFFPVNAQLQAVQLQCEYRDNPPGIDETQPRLSWILDSGGKSRTQTAYRILAASSAENLSLDIGDYPLVCQIIDKKDVGMLGLIYALKLSYQIHLLEHSGFRFSLYHGTK